MTIGKTEKQKLVVAHSPYTFILLRNI